MPTLTDQQLATLAHTGATNREIRAAQDSDLTDAQKQIVDRARVVRRIRKAQAKHGPNNAAERKRKQRAREHGINRRECEDPKRRARLEKTPLKWLTHYMPAAFDLSWSAGHKAIIKGAIAAVKSGTGVAVAAPRGEGKTTVLRGICIYLIATRMVRFVVMAGWTHKSASEGFRFWLRMLRNSPEFSADYPELTQPFEESRHAMRLRTMTWADTTEECGADIRATDKILVLSDSVGAMAAASVQGDIKGLTINLPDGTVLRPDLLLIDDAQDPKRADNPDHVADVVSRIEKEWMCLAGPQSRITTMVACTVAARDDVSEQFLNRSDFKAVRVPRVISWPPGWDDHESDVRELWREWNAIREDGMKNDDEGKADRAFYKEHKTALTKGMTVSWDERRDIKRKDPDALYSAMLDLHRIGESAFASEYQNEPLTDDIETYKLFPSLIMARVEDRKPFTRPDWVHTIVGATDVNPSYALTSVLVGFGEYQQAAVLWYGRYTKPPIPIADDLPAHEWAALLFDALTRHGRELAGFPVRPALWVIDAGGAQFDVVLQFAAKAQKLCGLPALGATGRGASKYRPYGRNVIKLHNQAHQSLDKTKVPPRRWLVWNTDYWREVAQRAWRGELGAPGSVSLCEGRHQDFASQICREELRGKAEVGGEMRWNWHRQPGENDYGDAMNMAYVGAEVVGIGVEGRRRRRKYVETRKAKAV
ncbi:MAG: terminase gpA endonuclease subunit [Pseudomonadota bacterium]